MSKSHVAQRVGRYVAFGAVGSALALSPLGLSHADPEPGTDSGTITTVTATVTAVIGVDQCEPLPDGRLPQQARDYMNRDGEVVPETTGAPVPADSALPPGDTNLFTGKLFPLAPGGGGSAAEPDSQLEDLPRGDGPAPVAREDGKIEGTGPFDPYLCTPAASTTPETTTITPEPGPQLEDLPGVTPTLREYPSGSGLTDGGPANGGPQLGAVDEDNRPTEDPLPGTVPGGGSPGALQPAPRPLGS